MAWPRWRHTLEEAKRLAIKAIDEYNCSTGHYADFIGTMVRAWLYLLQAEFHRDGVDYRYLDDDGSPVLIDGEPKLWDVLQSVKQRFPASNDPIRRNLELFVALRNRVEHRYEHALKEVAGGRTHALVINFESELSTQFGTLHSLADRLRFPLFVQSITSTAKKESISATRALNAARTVLAKFDLDLDAEILEDQRYDFRVRLVPMLGPRTEADAAFQFVKLDELSDDERQVMTEAGRTGNVITKVKTVPVSGLGHMLPKRVVAEVQKRVPFQFNMRLHTRLRKHFKVRPSAWTGSDGGSTVAQYCVANEPTRQFVYTPDWVDKIVKEVGTAEKFQAFFGAPPQKGKVSAIRTAPSTKDRVISDWQQLDAG